jgi:hypothetical protein
MFIIRGQRRQKSFCLHRSHALHCAEMASIKGLFACYSEVAAKGLITDIHQFKLQLAVESNMLQSVTQPTCSS